MRGQFSALEMAKHAVVHEYRGGAVKLGPRVGMNPGTLSNKVNPTIDTHHLTVDEAVAIQHAAGDYRIIEAEAAALGGVFIQLGNFSEVSDVELLDAYARYHAEIGETAEAIRDALEDRRVTRQAVEKVRAEAFEDAAAMFALIERLDGLVDDDG